jgi:hypothetical protein
LKSRRASFESQNSENEEDEEEDENQKLKYLSKRLMVDDSDDDVPDTTLKNSLSPVNDKVENLIMGKINIFLVQVSTTFSIWKIPNFF